MYPGRKLMPAKTRAFVEMLQRALGGPSLPFGTEQA
jgi:hypothetical protein